MAVSGMTLKLERTRAKVTQTALAHELACSRQLVTKWEAQDAVKPEEVRRYRIALLQCADIVQDVAS